MEYSWVGSVANSFLLEDAPTLRQKETNVSLCVTAHVSRVSDKINNPKGEAVLIICRCAYERSTWRLHCGIVFTWNRCGWLDVDYQYLPKTVSKLNTEFVFGIGYSTAGHYGSHEVQCEPLCHTPSHRTPTLAALSRLSDTLKHLLHSGWSWGENTWTSNAHKYHRASLLPLWWAASVTTWHGDWQVTMAIARSSVSYSQTF